MEKFLETHKLPKLTQSEIENLNRPVRNNKIESVIKNFPKRKYLGPGCFIGELYQRFREELTPVLLKLFQKFEEEETLNTFYEFSIILIPKIGKTISRKV